MPVVSDAGSTVPRRQLGRRLRQLREDARITVKAAADALEWSTPKLWRIEGGMVSMRSLDVEAMCRVYGATEAVTASLMALAKDTRARGWWQAYSDAIPGWFELYIGLEAAASRLRTYQPELVPELLQSEAYATETVRVAHPELSDDEVARAVAVRLSRQALLGRRAPAPPRLDVVLNEPALRRPLRDPAAMAEQLRLINTVGERRNVSVLVLPLDAGLHPGALAGGPFTLLEFPDRDGQETEPPTVYREALTGASYLDKPAEVEVHAAVWSAVRDAALDRAASRDLIAELAKEYD
ncbi:helix-turn-helix domain-containing protein [Micromonospora zhanjiangensis]|uniref:Helix-turn-helix domain-containing protein n=1 Tax=Micromonospora zhanjiangensis TaxID=1522057 RepID=A0ABV8KN84_9ACTN